MHGLRPSRLSQEPPFCPQTCSWRYVAACANPCHFAGTRAALRMGVEEQSIDLAITHSRAPAQVYSPGGQRSWNMPGCVSRAGRWELMARLSPSNGLHTLQPQTLELKTVGGLTSSCTEPHRTAARCAATPRLYPRSRGLGTRSHAPLPSKEPRCEWPRDASTPRSRSLRVRGRSSSSPAQR